jgi:hypothetical protein
MTDEEDEGAIEALQDTLDRMVENGVATIDDLADDIRDPRVSDHLDNVAKNLEVTTDELKQAITSKAAGNDIAAITKLLEVSKSTSGKVGTVGSAVTVGSFAIAPWLPIVTTPVVTIGMIGNELRDDRELHALGIEEEAVPDEATIHRSDEPPLADNKDIQFLLKRLSDSDENEESLEQSLKRIIDFDTIDGILDEIEFTTIDSETGFDGYYVRHDGEIIVLMLHEPEE